MPTIRYRDRDEGGNRALFISIGALAGVAAGILLAHRMGGLSTLTRRLRDRLAAAGDETDDALDRARRHDGSEYEEDQFDESDETLEERVLEAFRNDPVLSERAIDIGAIGHGIIELTGWVHTDAETQHAVTVARGIPGVETVVNRLAVREADARFDSSARRYASGDDALTEGHWEGIQQGTGRRRQGTSAEPDRHATPKPVLEERWLREDAALMSAADEVEGLAERRQGAEPAPGDRNGGAPVAPTGVPKGDHVADPDSAADIQRAQTGRVSRPANGEDAPRAD
jgi:hypothetical protein